MIRIKLDWPNIAGLGPWAWDRDNQPLNMHPLHLEKIQQKKREEDGNKAPMNTDKKHRTMRHSQGGR